MENKIMEFLHDANLDIEHIEFLEQTEEAYIFAANLYDDQEAYIEVTLFNEIIINGKERPDLYLPFNVWSK
jgi:hypothetical protein